MGWLILGKFKEGTGEWNCEGGYRNGDEYHEESAAEEVKGLADFIDENEVDQGDNGSGEGGEERFFQTGAGRGQREGDHGGGDD